MVNNDIPACSPQLAHTIHEKCKRILAQLGDVRLEIVYKPDCQNPDVYFMIDYENEMVETGDLHGVEIDTTSPFEVARVLMDELADLAPICSRCGPNYLITVVALLPECVVRDNYVLPLLGVDRTEHLLGDIRTQANRVFANYAEMWIIVRRNLADSESYTSDPDVHRYDLSEEPQWIEVATRDAIVTEAVLYHYFSSNPSFTVTRTGYLVSRIDDDDLWLKVSLK